MKHPAAGFLTTGAMVAASAALGTAASDPDSAWYRHLDKPSWNPPNPVFPIAWTSLYADIAVSTGIALNTSRATDQEQARRYLAAVALNLALNTGWSFAFFRWHRPGLAAVWAAALAASSADLAVRTGKIDRRAGWALAPYAAWTSFATALATSIWRRNH